MAENPTQEHRQVVRPKPLEVGMSVSQFIDRACLGSTAGELAAIAQALTGEVLNDPDVLVGVSLDARLMAGGTGIAALAPLMAGGYIDWAVITGTNLYYDALYALGKTFHFAPAGPRQGESDCGGGVVISQAEREAAETELREILSAADFQQAMGSAELHDRLGVHLRTREKNLGVEYPSLLTAAQDAGVPIYNPSPADNPLGSLVAHLSLVGNRLALEPSVDLNEGAALLHGATLEGRRCALWCLGRGTAADFLFGVPDHLATMLGPEHRIHYAARIRMADQAHGIPGAAMATPFPIGAEPPLAGQEAIVPEETTDRSLSTDLTIALPLLAAYILDRLPPRPLKRLARRRDDLLDRLRLTYQQSALRQAYRQSALRRKP
ncbi:MAG: deoxyhypusine synthase family protein [Candidatus Eisenbacteria sp.]|nr:deoxyhypusine synthase family protein [Candidatus Eisenbacteria bacterium]